MARQGAENNSGEQKMGDFTEGRGEGDRQGIFTEGNEGNEDMSQSNTRVGDIRVLAGESLTGMEDRLVKMTHDTGAAEVLSRSSMTPFEC